MRNLCFIVLFLSTTGVIGKADDATTPTGPMANLAPLVGQWRIDTEWKTSGQPLKARIVFEWGPGQKFLISRTYVSRNDGTEYERYHEVFAVEDGKLMDHLFNFDGQTHVREIQMAGTSLKSEWKTPDAQPPVTLRQELSNIGKDKLRWQLWIVREDKTDQIMDGQWVRDTTPAERK